MILPTLAILIFLELSFNHIFLLSGNLQWLPIPHSNKSLNSIQHPWWSVWNLSFQPLSSPCPEPHCTAVLPWLLVWPLCLEPCFLLWTSRAHCLRCPLRISAYCKLYLLQKIGEILWDWRSFPRLNFSPLYPGEGSMHQIDICTLAWFFW